MGIILRRKKKGKEEKANVTEETEKESALVMVISDKYGEISDK